MADNIPTVNFRNYPNVCRICLSNEAEGSSEEDLIPIEDIYMARCKITESITSFRDILTIFVNDEMDTNGQLLPSNICLNCAKRAQEAYKFAEQCRMTDQLLESYFNSLKDASIENEDDEQKIQLDDVGEKTEIITTDELTEHKARIAIEREEDSNEELKEKPKSFYCDTCDKTFSQSQTLRRHNRLHDKTGSSIKSCPFCSKTFLRSDDLTRHIRTHTGERPYKCPLCPKAYKQWSELNEHRWTHKAQKKFECTECSKKLTSRNGLYVHMKGHRGDKAFICTYCSKCFTTSGALTAHVRRVHPHNASDLGASKRLKLT